MIHERALIHPLACVTDSDVGPNVQIWQFASVIRGAIIEEGVKIACNAMIDGSYVGKNSIISQGVSVSPGFVINEDCFLGPGVVLCNDMWPRAEKSGWPGFICATAFHDREMREKHAAVIVESGASIGANATILPGVILGEGSMIAAGATVGVNVPPGMLFMRDGRLIEITPEFEKKRKETRSRHAIRLKHAMEA